MLARLILFVRPLSKKGVRGMLLTAKSLSELIRSLRSNPRAAAEKRGEMRVGIRTKIGLVLLDPATGAPRERYSAWVRDVSAGGVGLLCGRRFKDGEPFDLLIEGPKGEEERVPCMITYCQSVATDLFRVGARFMFPSAFSQDEQA
jgi:hypothetical protein